MAKNRSKHYVVEALENLGIGENGASLYVTLLRHPSSTVQELQTKTPFPRTMLYYVLGRLEQDSLVSSKKSKGKTRYSAESPDRLYDLLAKREEEFNNRTQSLRELIPTLKQRYRLAGKRPDLRVFEGLDEYKKSLDDILVSTPKEILAFGDPDARQVSGIEARETHNGRRKKKQILKKVLLKDTREARTYLKHRLYDDYTQFRILPKDLDTFTVDVQLYDGKLLYTTYEDREPLAILLEDRAYYTMQKSFFDLLWSKSEDVTLARFHTDTL